MLRLHVSGLTIWKPMLGDDSFFLSFFKIFFCTIFQVFDILCKILKVNLSSNNLPETLHLPWLPPSSSVSIVNFEQVNCRLGSHFYYIRLVGLSTMVNGLWCGSLTYSQLWCFWKNLNLFHCRKWSL